MTKSLYDKLKSEPRALTPAEEVLAGEFLWENFWLDFRAKRKKGISRSLIEANLKRLLHNHGADVPQNLLSYMKDDDVFRAATELYTYIQLTCKGIQTEFWPKAINQSNPYVLRYHVFALHNRMYDLMTKHKKPGDKHWEAERNNTYVEAFSMINQIEKLADKVPAFTHFLLGYTHYTLAIGATADHAKKHWEAAYREFLLCEATEKKNPKAAFIVNLGKDTFKDMPFENLEPIKNQIEERLTEDEIYAIKSNIKRPNEGPKGG